MYPLPTQNANPRLYQSYPDPNNTIHRPTGPQYQLSLSEGTYVLRDQIQLGLPPPLPSQTNNLNPLDTRVQPPTAGTRLSLAVLAHRKEIKIPQYSFPATNGKPTTWENAEDGVVNTQNATADNKQHHFAGISAGNLRALAFGAGNSGAPQTAPQKEVKDPLKRRKPKQGILKSSGSSLISAAANHANLTKRLHERKVDAVLAIANVDRVLQLLDFASDDLKVQYMTRIFFGSAHPLCHDINEFSKTTNHLDVIIGFSTSDIMWYEPISQKYSRINKRGIINPTPVYSIRWLPGSENVFFAAHSDGSLVVYDKEREDSPLTVEEEIRHLTDAKGANGRRLIAQVKKSTQSKNQKTNPVACYKVTKHRINGLEFSPDGRFAAVASEDGSLRILDVLREQLIDLYSAYYGGMTCLCWSPDGKYILSGSEDDLISIWSFEERALIARCVGHKSWVTCLAFDLWRCDDNNYRFGSVGEDRRLLLWDFSAGTVHRPRAASIRPSISSHSPTADRISRFEFPSSLNVGEQKESQGSRISQEEIDHAIEPRANVPMLPPVFSKQIDENHHALSSIAFEEDCMVTACAAGHIITWERPKPQDDEPSSTTSTFYDAFR